MNLFDCILWDLDGTIMDIKDGLLDAVRTTIYNDESLYNLSDEQINEFIGPSFEDSIVKFYNLEEQDVIDVTQKFKYNYKIKGMFNSLPI